MNEQIIAIAERIRGLRLILEITEEQMAIATDTSLEQYLSLEKGEKDFSFTFLFKCANMFKIDISELLTGEVPKLSFYCLVRANEGMPIERRKGFKYQHLAYLFKHRIAEPFLVTAKYSEETEKNEIAISSHVGQELNYILSGSLKVRLKDNIEILNPGDTIMYDSGEPHGMIAINGDDCNFLAIVLKHDEEVV